MEWRAVGPGVQHHDRPAGLGQFDRQGKSHWPTAGNRHIIAIHRQNLDTLFAVVLDIETVYGVRNRENLPMNDHAPASVIWMRPTRGSRGPEPSRDREAITAVAIGIADREGLVVVSMWWLSAEIGTGTSSLYRYFARKDDLLNLMVDGALGVGVMATTGNWLEDLRYMAHATRALFLVYFWLVLFF